MNPLAIVCRTHGIWLTAVATRVLAGVRHAGDFGGLVQQLAAAQAWLDEGPAGVGNALWLQNLCTSPSDVHLPWGKTQPHDLIRIVDAVARDVISVSEPGAVKDFDFEISAAQRMGMSLPTRLRQRQWALCRVADVLRLAPGMRKLHSSWSAASAKRLASMRNFPDGVSLGSVPQQPSWFGGRTSCERNSASRPGTSRPARPCLRRSSERSRRLAFGPADEGSFADFSFRLAVHSFNVAVIQFFDGQLGCASQKKVPPSVR